MKTQWEYMTIKLEVPQSWTGSKGSLDTSILTNELNALGKDGWELVSTEDLERPSGSANLLCILKREI